MRAYTMYIQPRFELLPCSCGSVAQDDKRKLGANRVESAGEGAVVGALFHLCSLWIWRAMTMVDQLLTLALSKEPLTWGRKQTQFPKRCVFEYFEFRTMDKAHKAIVSEFWPLVEIGTLPRLCVLHLICSELVWNTDYAFELLHIGETKHSRKNESHTF
jgi:hypothetical protein